MRSFFASAKKVPLENNDTPPQWHATCLRKASTLPGVVPLRLYLFLHCLEQPPGGTGTIKSGRLTGNLLTRLSEPLQLKTAPGTIPTLLH